jgi:serine/threonine-protein kinase/endoribonuclease IRE1
MNNSVGIGISRNEGSTIAGAGPGSVGWQAPEVMAHRLSPKSPLLHDESSGPEAMLEASPIDASLNGRTSRSVDIFSLGCIFFCTILPRSHPLGEWYEREANIMKNCLTAKALKQITVDAADLVISMLHRSPRSRPTAKQVCVHPFFWSPMKRCHFCAIYRIV